MEEMEVRVKQLNRVLWNDLVLTMMLSSQQLSFTVNDWVRSVGVYETTLLLGNSKVMTAGGMRCQVPLNCPPSTHK